MKQHDARGARRVAAPAALAAGLLFLAAAPPAHAAETAPASSEAGAASAAGESVFSNWGISPRYDSTFRVNRRERSWDQKLSFSRTGGVANLNVNLNVKSREDESRNDFDEGIGGFTVTASRKTGLGNFSLNGTANRRYTQTSQSLHSRNSDQLSFGNSVALYATDATDVTLNLGLGWVEDRETKENYRLGKTVDRTIATGWEAEAGLTGTWTLNSALAVDAGTSWNGITRSSRTTHREDGETEAVEADDQNRDNRAFANLEWTLGEGLHVDVTTNWTDAVAQYYQASAETQETKRSNRRSFALSADGAYAERLGYSAAITADRQQFDYQVESNDKLMSTEKFELTLEYMPVLPLLRGGTVTGTAARSKKRTELQRTTPSTIEGTLLEAKFTRPLGEQLTFSVRMRGDLDQFFYDDESQDRDKLVIRTQTFLRYKRGAGLRASLGYASSETQTVYIPRASAAQNQTERNYRVTADYDALLPAGIAISQKFQISANYTYFVYAEDQNALRRSNRVDTRLSVPLVEHSTITVEHHYEKGDRGLYLYSEGGDREEYSKGLLTLRQDLSVEAEYVIAGVLTLRATETLRITSSKTPATGAISRRENHTFSGFAGLRHELENGMTVTADFERTESNNEDPYWRINARVQKTFN
jgi:hypothetical protein